MLETQFIPYEQAQGLEDLGFKQICLGVWERGELYVGESNPDTISAKEIMAPTWSQAFDWFRENFGFLSTISRMYDWNNDDPQFLGYCVYIGNNPPNKHLDCNDFFIKNFYKTYEEARLECLKELIKLC